MDAAVYIGNPRGFIYDSYHAVFIDYIQELLYFFKYFMIKNVGLNHLQQHEIAYLNFLYVKMFPLKIS